ncbi:MAG: serine protease, partial [Betaproteobacteria bacterium]
MIDSLLLTATRIGTFEHDRPLTNASGFFFERDRRLHLVTSRHVLVDAPSNHFPNRIEIELHVSEIDLSQSIGFSIFIYDQGRSLWRQGTDSGGEIDIAMIELDRTALPATGVLRAFTPEHLRVVP